MVASDFIIWTTDSTLMFGVFTTILVVLLAIAVIAVREGVWFCAPILIFVGLLLFGLFGVLAPHRWAVGDEHSRQSYADLRVEYPNLIAYSTSVNDHWAWVRVRGCSDQRAVQVPLHRQPKLGNHYWLTGDTLFVAKPKIHDSIADFDQAVMQKSQTTGLCTSS